MRNQQGARSLVDGVGRPGGRLGSRGKRKRPLLIESLEDRRLLSYVISNYTSGATGTATVTESGGSDSFVIANDGNGLLAYSEDGGAFSTQWGSTAGDTLSALAAGVTITVNLGANDSSIGDGNNTTAASNVKVALDLNAYAGNTSDSLTVNDSAWTFGSNSYTYSGSAGTITGPQSNINITEGSAAFGGGVHITGNNLTNTFTVASTRVVSSVGEPVTITGGTGADTADVELTTADAPVTLNLGTGANVTNLGNSDSLSGLLAPVIVNGSGTINADDSADTVAPTNATFDNNYGSVGGGYEFTGIAGAAINYGTAITAINVTSGSNEGSLVDYHFDETQTGTTTTVTGATDGTTLNDFLLGSASLTGGLSNLLGPIVVTGGTIDTDTATLNDTDSTTTPTYTVTSTTVTSTDTFAGFTYSDISVLTLDGQSTADTFHVNGTETGNTTNINAGNGANTVDVNGTGEEGTLNITTGTGAGQVVNVVAETEPVNITLGNTISNNQAVNIGSTGGNGSMVGVVGNVTITDPSGFYTLAFHDENDTTAKTWSLENDDTSGADGAATVSYGGIGDIDFRPRDLSSLTVNGGSGGNTFDVYDTTGYAPTTLNTGTGNDGVNVFATGDYVLNINGQSGLDGVELGNSTSAPLGAQGLQGTINIGNASGTTALYVEDAQDPVGQTGVLDNNGTTGSITGISPALINYTDSQTQSLHVTGGSGANAFTVNGTIPGALTTLNGGTGTSAVIVQATTADGELDIDSSGGPNTVLIGNDGSVAGIAGPIYLEPALASTALTIDSVNDAFGNTLALGSTGVTSTLTGLAGLNGNTITYETSSLSSLTIDTNGTYAETLNLSFQVANPIPISSTAGLIYNAGISGTSEPHVLNISGEVTSGPFTSEIHDAGDPTVSPPVGDYGSIQFTQVVTNAGPNNIQGQGFAETSLHYTDLSPIVDTAPAVNYTFNDEGYPDQSFSATSATLAGPTAALAFANTATPDLTPTFEMTTITNKQNVIFNSPAPISGVAGSGLGGLVNIPTKSVGLTTLAFNTITSANNAIDFEQLPTGVVSSYNGGTANDTVNITGTGVPVSTILAANGGAGTDTLVYNAGGSTPTIAATGSSYGELLIGLTGSGSVDAQNFDQVVVNDLPSPAGDLTVTPTAITAYAGVPLTNLSVGTFSFPLTGFFPNGTPVPANLPASDFTATITWGDTSSSAGVIVQLSNGTYEVLGSHTYSSVNSVTTNLSVTYTGGAVNGVVNNTPVTLMLSSATVTPGSGASSAVQNAPIVITALPFVGTAGISIAAHPIATFIATNGAEPVGDYSAEITIISPSGQTMSSAASSIIQFGTSNQYTVTMPAVTLPSPGTYQVEVVVTDSGPEEPVSIGSFTQAVIADAPMTAGEPVALTPNTGVSTGTVVVGTFTDADPTIALTGFSAIIYWGDGLSSVATITQPGGVGTAFDVNGKHTYANSGSYATSAFVTDAAGTTILVTGTATVTDLAVTGSTSNFTATTGIDTGLFVLATFTDPNTLATISDVEATLAIGGWGDGTPTSAGNSLVVQQIGVTPLTAGTDPGAPIFEVLGHHIYADVTPAGTPDSLSVIVTTLGGATTTLSSSPGSGVTVVDARLTSSNGTTITGVAGISTGDVLLGTFVDDNPSAVTGQFTTEVIWGDGSAPETVSVGQIDDFPGAPFFVDAAHTYVIPGTYAYSVEVLSNGGQTTVFSGSAVIADAPLTTGDPLPTISTTEASVYPVPVYAPPVFAGPVATFTDADPDATTAQFTALISWGDSTSETAGTVTEQGSTFTVSGSHTYAFAGTGSYPIQVFVTSAYGSKLTVANTADVASTNFALGGMLNPSSVSGTSGAGDVTNVVQPNFYGATSKGYATVTLYETPVGGGPTLSIGSTQADGAGAWSLTSNALPQGTFEITATAVDQFGVTSTGPVVITPSLTIDTQAPVITAVNFDRFAGRLQVTYSDALSGLDYASITNSAFYHISASPIRKQYPLPKLILPTSIQIIPGATPNAVSVYVTFDDGRLFRGGYYEIVIDSGTGNKGIHDVADNALAGNYYGQFPTGDGLAGGDFVGRLLTHDELMYPFVPVQDGYVPPLTGAQPAAVTSHAEARAAVVRKVEVAAVDAATAAVVHRTLVHDTAIKALATEFKAKKKFL